MYGWRCRFFKTQVSCNFSASTMTIILLLLFLHASSFCSCLNSEGMALLRFRDGVVRDPFDALSDWNDVEEEVDPCSWFGVECSDGKVVILDLKDLCLGGTLSSQLGKLADIRSIILRNNSFSGMVPKEIGQLKELEVLDLGFNNFSGPFPSDLGNNLSLAILLLDNNEYLGSISSELYDLKMLSEFQVDENQLTSAAFGASCISRSIPCTQSITYRRNLLVSDTSKPTKSAPTLSPSSLSPSMSPSSPPESFISSPTESPFGFFLPPSFSPEIPPIDPFPAPATPSITVFEPSPPNSAPMPSSASTPSHANHSARSKHYTAQILCGVAGGFMLIFVSTIGFIFYRRHKVISVNPWDTGLSGQLQQAFITGVPQVRRPELETACEDFSNVIGSLADGTVYKGTLSSGLEIAVMSISVTSHETWSNNLESQYRNKIDTLSKVNHKNFLNLVGFCEEEDDPFTRMMIFEYAPNGTLFEHLHVVEAEHLDWAMRLRIVMGIAYCLEYMHQQTPPISLTHLQSSSIYLTEDYAAKVSDLCFFSSSKTGSEDLSMNIYRFGVLLFEIITCRVQYSEEESYENWASMVDPSLEYVDEKELNKLIEVMNNCMNTDPNRRPTMSEITIELKEITKIEADGAVPKLSPLWWAQLEIMSTEVSEANDTSV